MNGVVERFQDIEMRSQEMVLSSESPDSGQRFVQNAETFLKSGPTSARPGCRLSAGWWKEPWENAPQITHGFRDSY